MIDDSNVSVAILSIEENNVEEEGNVVVARKGKYGYRDNNIPKDWSGDYSNSYHMDYFNCDITTTCCFSCMTVTTSRYLLNSSNSLSKPSKIISHKNPYNDQVSFSTPKFMSPLMDGHVSGLSNTKAKPLAKICKSRYFHELLIAERGKHIVLCLLLFFL